METDAIIFDVDGVLSNAEWRLHYILDRKPPEWETFYGLQGDDPAYPMPLRICKLLSAFYPILVSTGRPHRYREATERWLNRRGIYPSMILMRGTSEKRLPAEDLKELHLTAFLRSGFRILSAFEDHPETVRMYRRNGVFCFQPTNLWEELGNGYGAVEAEGRGDG